MTQFKIQNLKFKISNLKSSIFYLQSSINCEGFTLIELVLAVVVLVGAVFPVVDIFSNGFLSSQDTKNNIKAINLCRERLEIIKYLDFNNVEIGTDTINLGDISIEDVNKTLSILPGDYDEVTAVITQVFYVNQDNEITSENTKLKKIVVTAYLKNNKKSEKYYQALSLSTLLAEKEE